MPRRRCPICRSKQWHKEPATGLITCSEGHVLQNYRNETSERTEFTQHAMRKRTIKVQKDKNEDETEDSKADKTYHGPRARYFYFECLQLLLRMQINVLIQEWHLPAEFETVCRDLWALHLSLLPRPPEPEPYLHARVERGGEEEGSSPGRPEKPETPPSSGSEAGPDANAADLLKEASETESSSSSLDEEAAKTRIRKDIKRDKTTRNKYEVPAGNIAVLVMACWTMRVPLMYKDLIRLIEEYKLPYMEGVRLLPVDMKRHLGRETKSMLSPRFPPTVKTLHSLASRLARLCYTRFGIYTPEMNAAPLLWRNVRAMKGQAPLYELTKKMIRELSVPLTLDVALAPELEKKRKTDAGRHKGDNVPVEMALMGALVVVLKLVYGLDGRRRDAMMEEEPGMALPGWEEYLAELGKEEEEVFLESRPGRRILDMADDELDAYLRFCERALLEPGDDTEKIVSEFFPLREEGSSSSSSSLSSLRTSDIPGVGAAARWLGSEKIPAGIIRIYDTRDVLGTLPPPFKFVLERAARFCAVNVDYLAALVERFEHRLVAQARASI